MASQQAAAQATLMELKDIQELLVAAALAVLAVSE
jgi:hypothetical protein